LQSIY